MSIAQDILKKHIKIKMAEANEVIVGKYLNRNQQVPATWVTYVTALSALSSHPAQLDANKNLDMTGIVWPTKPADELV